MRLIRFEMECCLFDKIRANIVTSVFGWESLSFP